MIRKLYREDDLGLKLIKTSAFAEVFIFSVADLAYEKRGNQKTSCLESVSIVKLTFV
jgi:hypothetical protein